MNDWFAIKLICTNCDFSWREQIPAKTKVTADEKGGVYLREMNYIYCPNCRRFEEVTRPARA